MSEPSTNLPRTTASSAQTSSPPDRPKPRLSLAIATAFGLGYLPIAPGTFGSLLGLALAAIFFSLFASHPVDLNMADRYFVIPPYGTFALLILVVSAAGVITASRTASYLSVKDPQIVVVDEVAGQLISYLGLATALTFVANWKYLLLGFILFRVFDIWKPFPARQAEYLPGGLGIMADDWIAGIYAGIGLWVVRMLGARFGFHLL